jgi:Ca-activated chloride channel family protein
MHPAVSTRLDRRKTFSLLAASTAVVIVAALLTARGPARRAAASDCASGTEQTVGGMRLAVRAQQCRLLRGATETHVAVELTAPMSQRAGREPVALALVIDRSRSMIHEPLRDAKIAALRAIDALSERDAFSVVIYSTAAEQIVGLGAATEAHKAKARAAIERLTAAGGTNISDGLIKGAAALAGPCEGDCPREHVSRILLISDGVPNDGIWDHEGLVALAARTAETGVSITTVGVGLEFNERIMSEMAVAGRGNYYFVEQFADLATMFDQELASLGETVAVDTRLELVPAAGVTIVEAYGYRIERKDGTTIVPIADLRAGESRKVVVRVRVTADRAGELDLVSTRLAWRPVGAHQLRVIDSRLAVTVTDDAAAVERSTIAAAERQVQEAQMANAIDQATEAYELGDTSRANQILEGRARAAAEAAAAIGDADLGRRLDDVKQKASQNFAVPARGAAGSRATKANRNLSYELAR